MIPAHCASKSFTDVDTNQWYHTYVDCVVTTASANGMGGGRLPQRQCDLAQLVTTLYRMAGSPQVAEMSTLRMCLPIGGILPQWPGPRMWVLQ